MKDPVHVILGNRSKHRKNSLGTLGDEDWGQKAYREPDQSRFQKGKESAPRSQHKTFEGSLRSASLPNAANKSAPKRVGGVERLHSSLGDSGDGFGEYSGCLGGLRITLGATQ